LSRSFDDFVVQASPRLLRAAMLLTGSRADAEDVTQEALLAVYRRWERLRAPQAAYTYASVTMTRLAHRHLRKARARREVNLADLPDRASLDVAIDASVEGAAMRTMLLTLPPRQREAVVLRFYLDLSVETVARAMRCTPGTVKSQVSKALATLRSDRRLRSDRQLADQDEETIHE
jgi:RNA polymerase sigma-70 factor (sigma-E family)